jgi:signal transduction histidine kinase/CheY-like chemotaxis protein
MKLKKFFYPNEKLINNQLQFWRETILGLILLVFAISTFFVYFPSTIISIIESLWPVVVFNTIALAWIAITIFYKPSAFKFRSISILTFIFITGAFILICLGHRGAGYLWLFCFPVMIGVLLGFRSSIIALSINCIFLTIAVFLKFKGVIPLFDDKTTPSAWLIVSINFIFLNILISLSLAWLMKGLKTILSKNKTLIIQLQEEQNHLEKKVIEKTKDLEEARDKAEMASSAKSNFFAVMSHEIRTPLNAIIGMTDLVLDSKLIKEQRDYLLTVKDSSYHLLHIINDVLDFSKIESKSLTVKYKEFDLDNLLNTTLKLFSAPAKVKFLDLKLKNDFKYGIIKSDSILIKQILINLIGNAIKFTEKGSVVLNVSHEGLIKKGYIFTLAIAVTDTGIGIKKEDMGKIFKSFEQIDNSITRKFDGTGLGLTISRELCVLLDGEINVESEEGEGSSFIITIPVTYISSENKIENIDKPDGLISDKVLKILLVEDNRVNAKMAIITLQRNNHIITHAESGENAIELLKNNRYDCILMDIEMPGMSGIDAVKIIRKGDAGIENVDIPIIAVTAHVLDDLIKEFEEAGFDEFLSKPIQILKFNAIIFNTIKEKLKR